MKERTNQQFLAVTTFIMICLLMCGNQTVLADTGVEKLGAISTPGESRRVVVVDQFAYVAEGDSGFSVIDVANKAEPVRRSSIGVPRGKPAIDVAVQGDYAYVFEYWGGLRIVNIVNPDSIYTVGYYVNAFANGGTVSGNYAYLLEYWAGVHVVDISNPSAPSRVSLYETPGLANAMAVAGNYAYLGEGGIQVLDITNPADLAQVGYYQRGSIIRDIAFAWNYLYFVDGDFGVVDVTNPAEPTEVSTMVTDGHAGGIKVYRDDDDGTSFVADGDNGLLIIAHHGGLANNRIIGSYNSPGDARGLALVGSDVYLADWTELGIYDCRKAMDVREKEFPLPLTSAIVTAFPNPFNSSTIITFQTSVPSDVTVAVYDLSGRIVATLAEGFREAGSHTVNWNAGNFANGLYIVRLAGNGVSVSRKIVLIK